jgi:ketosteroid isomerase-like protein
MCLRAQATLLLLALLSGACTSGGASLTHSERRAIADTVEGLLRRAYDVSGPSAGSDRLISLYSDSGRVVSAGGGRIMTSRDSLVAGIRDFWESIGRNMREPRWIWEQMATDVLSSDAAVVTATYRVPHRTPRGEPHEIAGAMTLVFARRGGRWIVVQEHVSDRPPNQEPVPPMSGDTARSPG